MAAPAYLPPNPQKTLYRIGEVSKLTNTKAFVLRYWETEFPTLQPVKSPSGHRLYRKEDIETVHEIKRLLYDKGFTIAGARRHLAELNGNGDQRAERMATSSPTLAPSQDPPRRDSAISLRSETSRGYVAPSENEFESTQKIQNAAPGVHYAYTDSANAGDVQTLSNEPSTESQTTFHRAARPADNPGISAAAGAAPAKAPAVPNEAQRAVLLELREELSSILTLLERE